MSDERKKTLYYLSQLNTREIFPKLYDGFKEIDELAKGEEELISVARDCVKLVASDKYITEVNATKIAEFESELGLSPTGLSIDERREQLAEFLGRDRVINDAAVHEKAKRESGIDDIKVDTDCTALTMVISSPENSEDEDEGQKVIDAASAMLPYAPQNLSISAAVKSTNDVNINAFTTQFSTLRSDAGDATCDVLFKLKNMPVEGRVKVLKVWRIITGKSLEDANDDVAAYYNGYTDPSVGLGGELQYSDMMKAVNYWNSSENPEYPNSGIAYLDYVAQIPPAPEVMFHYGMMSDEGDTGGKLIETGTVSDYALAYTANLVPTPQPEFRMMSTHNDTIVVDLNNEWAIVDPNSPNLDEFDMVALNSIGSGHTIFKSVSNKGIQSSVATAYIRTDFLYDDSQKIYTMNCAESGSDYIEMKLGGIRVFQDTTYTGEFTEQEFEIPAGEQEFIVTFTKDSSEDELGDCAYFAIQANKISSIINAAPLPEPEPVYTPKYVRLSFGTARNDVTINAGAKSSVALKFYYGGTQYGDIGKYLTGDGSPLNFSIAMAKTKAGANVDTSNLVVHGTSDADLNLYVYNNSDSAVTLATIWIEIPRYTYAVYGQGATINSTTNLNANGYVNLLGANPTWNYTYLPNALYKLMGAPDNLFDCEFRNSDGTYSTRSELKILIGTSYMNVQNITDQIIYYVPSCRFETWLPEMYNLVNGEMVLIGASALSLEEE